MKRINTRVLARKVIAGVSALLMTGFSLCAAEPAAAEPAAAKVQESCPLMDGKINKELFVDVDGKRLYLCCNACLETAQKDPAGAVKKLAEKGEAPIDTPIAQKTCPVMGGAINPALFVEHEGSKLYVCCAGCLAPVKKEPSKYAAKIAEEIKKAKEPEAVPATEKQTKEEAGK